MRIVERQKDSKRRLFSRLLSLPSLIGAALLGAFFLGALLLGVIVGAYFEDTGNERYIRSLTHSSFAQNFVHKGLSWSKAAASGENVPMNLGRGVIAVADADQLVLDIAHLDYQRLAHKREQALDLGLLFTDASDYVPARISNGQESVRARVRLKGDLEDHFDTEKWSLRIVVKGDNTFWGMKVFSIQRPKTRKYMGEWFFNQALLREGLVTPRYRFINVTINGERKGIYALEEHFERRLVENSRRREGPILRFNEDLLWDRHLTGYDDEEFGGYSSSPIEGYAADKSHGSEFERAVSLLEAFRLGELTTSQVFDVDKLAVYVAMRDLCGGAGLPWQNFRLFYDPVTSRLEPVAFDSEVDFHDSIDMLFCFDGGVTYKGPFFVKRPRPDDPIKAFFADPVFFESYVRALDRLSQPEYLDDLIAAVGDELENQLHVLYRDSPEFTWTVEPFRENQEFIRQALAPPRAVHAFHEATHSDGVDLRVGNIQSVAVEVLGLARGTGPVAELDAPIVLGSKRRYRPVDYQRLRLPVPGDSAAAASPEELVLHCRLIGTDRVMTQAVYPWTHRVDDLVQRDWIGNPGNVADFPWLSIDEEDSTVRVAAGEHVLDRDLVVPAGYTFVAGPGARIDLRKGAKLVSYSKLNLMGSEEQPVVLESTDSSGQGLLVLQAGELSSLVHVIFDNLDAPHGNGGRVPAAVTFYESPVEMEDVVFRASRCEDALNVMRTWFTLRRTVFVDNVADSFDGDFVEGRIEDCGFSRCGNDAIDLSGSLVELDDVWIDGVGDKALSAGENSEVVARNVRISDAELAVTSKDLSTVSFVDGSIRDSRVAFCAFQKKPEFGKGSIVAERVELSGIERMHLIEPGSSLELERREIEDYQEGVEELLYGAEYGRESD